MSFLIRAGLVIGVLSWLALQRQGAPAPPGVAEVGQAAWNALPDPLRAAALREGASEIGRRAGAVLPGLPASRDTLSDGDRTVPWRGAHIHADRAKLAEGRERPAP